MTTGNLTLPDWLADAGTKRERLRLIMAAVRRCYMEHPEGGMVPGGQHMTISMAEEFIAQMIEPDGEPADAGADLPPAFHEDQYPGG